MKWWLWGLGLGVIIGLLASGSAKADPGPYGRDYFFSYFTNQLINGLDWAFVPSAAANYDGLGPNCDVSCTVDLQSFEATYQARLYDTTSQVDQGRAAAEIDMMLGQPGPSFNGSIQAGITYAQDNFQNWKNLIQTYASGNVPGYSVQWNVDYNFANDPIDGLGVDAVSDINNNADLTDCTTGEGCVGDMAFQNNLDVDYDWGVVFNVNGQQFIIKHKCANITGNAYSLVIPPAPVTYQCGNVTPTPGMFQPGDVFTVTVNDTYTNGPPAYTNFSVGIPSISYTNTTATPIISTATSLSFTTPSLRAPPQAGTYTVNWQLYDGTTAVGPACSGLIKVVDLPYFSVYGADVSAGGDFNTCSANGGTLAGWYDSQTAKAGASTLFAAIALGKTNGFASGQNTATGPPGDTLSFSNTDDITGSSPSADFGVGYGGTQCIFTPVAPSGTPADAPASATVGVAPLTDGAHAHTGNVSLTGGTVGVGKNTALYVTGNVYIGSNIVYGTDAGGVWTISASGTTDVPSFTLVALGGNIYIDPGVTDLDGIYTAEASGGRGGTIYTCGLSNFTPVAAANLYGCNQQLTVHGSFIADQVNLMRTFGTLNNGVATENPNSGVARQCTNGVQALDCGAEVFDFSPELYLSTPAIQPPSNGDPVYDSVSSLPPVL